MEAVVALAIGTVVVLFVPALVWSTVIAGLYQIARDKIRESLKAATQRATANTK
jgi:hypothetical protein